MVEFGIRESPSSRLTDVGRTIACANQKGGVGKTTTVVNLASYLALGGDRVLVVDLDPQGNATSGLGIDRSSLDRSVYDAVVDGQPLGGLISRTAAVGVDLVPSTIALAGAEVELATAASRERRMRRLIEPIAADYDVIFIDSPPSLGLLTVNALTAADGVLIPLQCEYYALEGLTQLLATIDLVRNHLHPELGARRRRADHGRCPNQAVRRRRRRGPPPPWRDRVRHGHPTQRPPLRGAKPRAADLDVRA